MTTLPSLADLARRDGPRALHLFLCVLSVLALTNAGFDTSEGDYPLAQHILHQGSLGAEAPLGPIYAKAPDGRYYASHEVGNTLAMLPAVAAGNWLGARLAGLAVVDPEYFPRFLVSFVPCLSIAFTGVACFLALRWGFGFDPGAATTATLALVFCSTLWPYSRNLFEGVLAAAWLMAALAVAVAARATRGRAAAALTGLFLGAALITRTTSALFAPALCAYLAWAGWRREGSWRAAVTPVALALAAMSPFVAWQAFYNALRTGSALLTPLSLPQYQAANALDGNPLAGLAGFLVSPGKSMFLFSPLLVLSVVGARRFWRERPAEFWVIAGTAALFLLAHARLRVWTGDWGWGPRYLLTVTPWLLLPAAWALTARQPSRGPLARGRQAVIGALVALGLVVQIAAIVTNWHYRYAYLWQTHRLGSEVIWSVTGSQLTDTLIAAASNVGRLVGRDIAFDVVAGADPVNVRAANTLNVWWVSAVYAGVPRRVVVPIVAALAAVSAGLWITYRRGVRRVESRRS